MEAVSMKHQIDRVLGNESDLIWGVTGISYSDPGRGYSSAVVLAQGYSRSFTLESYNEEEYHVVLVSDRKRVDNIISRLKALFDRLHVKSPVPDFA